MVFDDEDDVREAQESAYCMFLDLLYDCEGTQHCCWIMTIRLNKYHYP